LNGDFKSAKIEKEERVIQIVKNISYLFKILKKCLRIPIAMFAQNKVQNPEEIQEVPRQESLDPAIRERVFLKFEGGRHVCH